VSDQAAFQEVDEAVRQDELKAWWKRWGGWVMAGVVAAVVVVAGLVGWRHYQVTEREKASAAYSAAVAQIASDKAAAVAALGKQAADAPEPYRSLATLVLAQLSDSSQKQAAALEALAPRLSPELSDLALILAAYRSVDDGKLEGLAGQIEALTAPERPFRVSARELQALAALGKSDVKTARDLWQEILRDPSAPPGEQQRAQAMLLLNPAPAEAKN